MMTVYQSSNDNIETSQLSHVAKCTEFLTKFVLKFKIIFLDKKHFKRKSDPVISQ